MLFPTVDFAVFFVIVFTGSWLLRPRRIAWRWFILLASCVFYLDPFNTQKSFLVLPALGAIVGLAVVTTLVNRAIAPDDAEAGSNRTALPVAATVLVVALYAVGNVWLHGAVPEKPDQAWVWLYLLLGIAFVNQTFAKAVFATMGEGRARTAVSRRLVQGAVVVNLAVLGLFKYYDWFRDSFDFLFSVPFLELALPIAISFFTFQAISYVVDVGRGELRPIALLDFCVYLSFFAHLVAGPIVRVGEFAPQLDQRVDPRYVQSGEAFLLIVRGMFKKVVISSYVGTNLVDPVFGPVGGSVPGDTSQIETLAGVLGYAIQIYADFSGYTDIAIGLALLLGIRFPQNFDQPYRSFSIQDFWRRWHMTLSRWLRDYLYIPLGGNRRGTQRTYVNLWLTMVLGGIWHGANWTFVIWGAIHGSALAAERWTTSRWAQRPQPMGLPPALVHIFQWALTFVIVCAAWVFFRASTAADAFSVFGLLVGSDVATPVSAEVMRTIWLGFAIIIASVAVQFLPTKVGKVVGEGFSRLAPAMQIVAMAIGFIVVDALGPEGIAPFIYFQF